MKELYYTVGLHQTRKLARLYPSTVEKWFVQLIRKSHINTRYESDRKASACEIAVDAAEGLNGSEATAAGSGG